MSESKAHWDSIFSHSKDQQMGWYEKDVQQTLKFLQSIHLTESSVIFLPGAGTSLLVDALMRVGCDLVLNDISDIALDKLRARVGDDARLTYFCHDMAKSFQRNFNLDLWIDRAVLHFLIDEKDIAQYFDNLRAAVKSGGYVLLAEYSTSGAKKCAGLELRQYAIEDMTRCLGNDFELLMSEEHTFINPANQPRPFLYGFFKRK